MSATAFYYLADCAGLLSIVLNAKFSNAESLGDCLKIEAVARKRGFECIFLLRNVHEIT